ncbi:MAG: DegT/DnrJ/EryC1/StrS aminotransferase [Pseudobdellovibrio sp.]|jgi:dTDP-4-amino-4,6-dideoxygalactose transaminase|nr:DegT/DnrJ/EryC1/StrS aminotransferase [Pseudobdellovibrio sp.]
MSLTIPIFKLQYSDSDRAFLKNGLDKILDEAYLTNHSFVRAFEQQFSLWNSSKYSVAVNNGTTAIESILRGLDVRGKEVIIPSNTFIACAVAVLNAGGIPVLCDMELEYLSIDPSHVAEKITRNTGAVLVVHIGGIISPSIITLKKICDDYGVPLVEDCAHAHGASYQGVRAGRAGAAGAFSFHMTKVMTTGEGGMVVTEDEKIQRALQSVRQFGKTEQNATMHDRDGSNFKMTEMQALMGLLELQRVEKRIQKRQQIAAVYDEKLKGSSWKTWSAPPSGVCPYYKKIVRSPVPREKVEETLNKNGISLTGGVYYIPVHKQDVFKNKFPGGEFKNTNSFSAEHFCPPCYPELELTEAEKICDVLLTIAK